jgi:hypothetical protein
VVGVDVEVVRPDLFDDGAPKVTDRAPDPAELVRGQATQNRAHPVLLERFDLIADPCALLGWPNDDDPSVVRDPDPLDEAALLHPIDETGGIADGDIEQLGEAAHRELTVMLEDPQNVEVRHADPGLDHPAGAGTAKASDHLVDFADDRLEERV